MKWTSYILFFGLLCGSSQSYSQYNAYALDQLSDSQLVQLASVVDSGTVIRIGGEEYEHKDYDVNPILDFAEMIDGQVAFMAGDYDPVFKYGLFGDRVSPEVTFKNEQWWEIEKWSYVRRDFWTYLFDRQRYYRKQADSHVSEALAFLQEMQGAGHDVSLILNVPLPENKFLLAYLDQVSKHPEIEKVSIHIYGKWKEGDYLQKLNSWLETITSYGWEVMVGEMSGLFNHAEGRELKNTDLHKNMHRAILDSLWAHGITEVYFFTLVATQESLNWPNPMIYNRWEVGDDYVLDKLDNVFQ